MQNYELRPASWTLSKLMACCWIILLVISGNTYAAKPVEPPFEDSLKDRYVIFAAELQPNGSFKVNRSLWDPRKQVYKTNDVTISNFSHLTENIPAQKENCYVFVASQYRKHRLYRDVIEENPNGMEIQTLPAVGAGMFACSPALLETYANLIEQKADCEKTHISNLLTLLRSTDSQSQRMAAFQLSMHPDWMALAGREHANGIRQELEKNTYPHELTEMLIQAAKNLPADYRSDWFKAYLLTTIQSQSLPYELTSFTPLLVRSSIMTLDELSLLDKADWDIIKPLLFSNAPGVAKATIKTLQQLDENRFRKEADEILADSSKASQLHAESQRALHSALQQQA